MKPTPGPWRIAHYGGVAPKLIVQGGLDVEVTSWLWPNERDATNAKLIAAAPSLLEACKAQVAFDDHCEECDGCREGSHCETALLLSTTAQGLTWTAMAKAEGKA